MTPRKEREQYAAFGNGFSGEGTKAQCEQWIQANGNGRLYQLVTSKKVMR